jgi:DNA modification methylase
MFIFAKGKPKTFNPILIKCSNAGDRVKSSSFRQDASGRQEKAHSQGKVSETRIKGNIWNIPSGYGKGTLDDVFSHPATFPESLARDHILSWTNPEDLVMDCFLGSGTTGKMAVKYQRNFIGMELAPEYLDIARARIDRVLAQPLLFEAV